VPGSFFLFPAVAADYQAFEERAGADARKLFEAFLRKIDKLEEARSCASITRPIRPESAK
jgi:hypothetical protein